MGFWDGTVGDGFSKGLWNSNAIPIMNELVQMHGGLSLRLDCGGGGHGIDELLSHPLRGPFGRAGAKHFRVLNC